MPWASDCTCNTHANYAIVPMTTHSYMHIPLLHIPLSHHSRFIALYYIPTYQPIYFDNLPHMRVSDLSWLYSITLYLLLIALWSNTVRTIWQYSLLITGLYPDYVVIRGRYSNMIYLYAIMVYHISGTIPILYYSDKCKSKIDKYLL